MSSPVLFCCVFLRLLAADSGLPISFCPFGDGNRRLSQKRCPIFSVLWKIGILGFLWKMRLVCFLRRINRYNPDIRYDWYAVIDSRWFDLAVTQGVQERLQRAFHSGFIEVF